MGRSLLDLSKDMTKLNRRIIERANTIKKETTRRIIKDLVPNTPVDTSRALSNWIVTNGVANNFSILPHAHGLAGSTRGVSMSTALAEAMSVIAKSKPGQPIFITNNIVYIKRLNEGHSKQAPAGFVERAELIGSNYIRTAKI